MNTPSPPMISAPVPPSPPPQRDLLKALVLSDLHIPLGMQVKDTILSKRDLLDAQDWVVLLGDVTACYGTPAEYREAGAFVAALRRPYDVVNGNHEFCFDPQPDGSETYGHVWKHADTAMQQAQLERFQAFYGLESRFRVHSHPSALLVMLGVDAPNACSGAELDPEHSNWLEQTLRTSPGKPLVVFCHFPLVDPRLDQVKYYSPGRKPYYAPSPSIRDVLMARSAPVVWISGHVHFAPSHPLAQPYRTELGVWQVHCPDGWGFGRPDDENWVPSHHEEVFVQQLSLAPGELRVSTVDLLRDRETPILHLVFMDTPAEKP